MAKRRFVLWGCLGCGGFVFLIFLFVAAGIGWVAYTAMETGSKFAETYQNLETSYKNLDQQFPFTPPADGIIPEERFTAYLQVRGDMSVVATEYLSRFEEIGTQIGEQFESGSLFDKFRGIGSIKDIIMTAINMIPELGGEHVKILSQQNMSLQEYAWICTVSIASLEKAEANNNTEAQAIWTEYQSNLTELQSKINEQNWNQYNNDNDVNFNYNNFISIVQRSDYKAENASLVIANKDTFLEHKHTPIIDYFVIQFADAALNKSTNAVQESVQ